MAGYVLSIISGGYMDLTGSSRKCCFQPEKCPKHLKMRLWGSPRNNSIKMELSKLTVTRVLLRKISREIHSIGKWIVPTYISSLEMEPSKNLTVEVSVSIKTSKAKQQYREIFWPIFLHEDFKLYWNRSLNFSSRLRLSQYVLHQHQ